MAQTAWVSLDFFMGNTGIARALVILELLDCCNYSASVSSFTVHICLFLSNSVPVHWF